MLPRSFSDVVLAGALGIDYALTVREPGAHTLVVALHGGTLAPGTGALAEAVAGSDHNLYLFRILRATDAEALCVSPLRAREPRLDNLIARSKTVLSIDRVLTLDAPGGAKDAVGLGGMNAGLVAALRGALSAAGYAVGPSPSRGAETSHAYFFNRAEEAGAELALPETLLAALAPAEGAGRADAGRADAGRADAGVVNDDAAERVRRLAAAVREGLRVYVTGARGDLARTLDRFERTTARIPPEVRAGPGRREPGMGSGGSGSNGQGDSA